MLLENISGNENILERLAAAAKSGKVSHAYIFEGDACVDKLEIAKAFAKAILCVEKPGAGCDSCAICRKINNGNHEDISYVFPNDKNNITVKEIADLMEALSKKPLAGDRNIAIIPEADLMNDAAQNKFLKTLEEPNVGTVVMLLCENMESLKDTIRSRCVKFSLSSNESNDYEDIRSDAEVLVDMISKRNTFYELSAFVDELFAGEDIDAARLKARRLLNAMENIYGDMASGRKKRSVAKDEIYRAVTAIEGAGADLKLNLKPEHVLKHTALIIGGNL